MSRSLTTIVFAAGVAFMLASFVAIRAMMAAPDDGSSGGITRWIQLNVMHEDPRDARQVQWARDQHMQRYDELTPEERVAYAEQLGLWEEADAARAEVPDGGLGSIDPLVIALLAGAVFASAGLLAAGLRRRRISAATPPPAPTANAPDPSLLIKSGGGVDNLDVLRATDPLFSRPAIYAVLQNLHRNAQWASVDHDWSGLEPFINPETRVIINQSNNNCREVGEIVLRTLSVRVEPDPTHTRLLVEFSGFREERGFDGRIHVTRFIDSWTVARPHGASSQAPEVLVALGCVSCGASPALTDDDGCCTTCNAEVVESEHAWRVVGCEPRPRTTLEALPLAAHYQIPSTAPLLRDPNLEAALARFQQRLPDFELGAFMQRTVDIFHLVKRGCRDGEWKALRPWVTDIAFEQIRYDHEIYEIAAQTNVHRQVRLERAELARVDADPFYTSITVRLWWTMLDYVENANGTIIDGDPDVPVPDSAYWTFQRVQGRGSVGGPLDACPKCGAPIDKVDETGTCTRCETWLCDGGKWWVLARRDTVASYHEN